MTPLGAFALTVATVPMPVNCFWLEGATITMPINGVRERLSYECAGYLSLFGGAYLQDRSWLMHVISYSGARVWDAPSTIAITARSRIDLGDPRCGGMALAEQSNCLARLYQADPSMLPVTAP